jgi:hypothetical protein
VRISIDTSGCLLAVNKAFDFVLGPQNRKASFGWLFCFGYCMDDQLYFSPRSIMASCAAIQNESRELAIKFVIPNLFKDVP